MVLIGMRLPRRENTVSEHDNEMIYDSVRRLEKPRAKGLLSLIFSRFFIFALLILVQIGLILYVVNLASEHIEHYLIIERIFAFLMIVYLFSCSMEASAKLTWMLIISLLPVAGAAILLFTKVNLGNRRISRAIASITKETKHALPQAEDVMEDLHVDGGNTDDLVRYLSRSGCFPAYRNTETVYFPSGEAKFEAVLKELEKATEYIFLEYFIIEEGYMWGRILETLIRKAEEGVIVRVMYDGMCEMSTVSPDYDKKLREVGIEAKPFSPIRPLVSSHYNYRDHRKILVVDGKVAFTGGVNLADEYINKKERFGHWKDAAVMIKGPAVKSFVLMFLQMWNIGSDTRELNAYLAEDHGPAEPEGGYVIPFCDSPLDDDKVGETVYMDILNRAGTYVHIMTPYLILDGELEMSLRYAAQRGVEVSLILPGIPDKKAAYALAKTHYRRLLDAGVHIYEYTPGFVHSKVFVSDDAKAVVGTINLDYRSLYHHFECAAYLYKTDCIRNIEEDFRTTLTECREVTYETIKNTSFTYKLLGVVMKFIAPLM